MLMRTETSKIRCLATGSTGNCYLLNLGGGCIILDAGVSIDNILAEQNLNDVDFAFISHQHKDHSRSFDKLKFRGVDTLDGFTNQDFIKIQKLSQFGGEYTIYQFPIEHGECNNNGIIIKYDEECILYLTDFNICKYNLHQFKFTRVLIECNYMEENINPNDIKMKRQINTHMGLKGCIKFLETLNLEKCYEIDLVHISPTVGDGIVMGSTINSKFKIPVGVCKQWGGIDYYGRR